MRRNPKQSGITLLEVIIASTLTAMITLGLAKAVDSGVALNERILNDDRGAEREQRLLGEIRHASFGALRVYGDSPVGTTLFAALENSGLPPLAGTQLPVPDRTGTLRPDAAGDRKVGNALFFLVEERPLDIENGGFSFRVDRVRFVAFYLTERTDALTAGDVTARLDLVRWISRPYVTKRSIERVPAGTTRTYVCTQLHGRGYRRTFTPDVLRNQAFHRITAGGAVTSSPVVDPVIAESTRVPARALFAKQSISVAPNKPRLNVPKFTFLDPTKPKFPSGFEVKIVGPFAASRVGVRLTALNGRRGHDASVIDVTRIFTIGAR